MTKGAGPACDRRGPLLDRLTVCCASAFRWGISPIPWVVRSVLPCSVIAVDRARSDTFLRGSPYIGRASYRSGGGTYLPLTNLQGAPAAKMVSRRRYCIPMMVCTPIIGRRTSKTAPQLVWSPIFTVLRSVWVLVRRRSCSAFSACCLASLSARSASAFASSSVSDASLSARIADLS